MVYLTVFWDEGRIRYEPWSHGETETTCLILDTQN